MGTGLHARVSTVQPPSKDRAPAPVSIRRLRGMVYAGDSGICTRTGPYFPLLILWGSWYLAPCSEHGHWRHHRRSDVHLRVALHTQHVHPNCLSPSTIAKPILRPHLVSHAEVAPVSTKIL